MQILSPLRGKKATEIAVAQKQSVLERRLSFCGGECTKGKSKRKGNHEKKGDQEREKEKARPLLKREEHFRYKSTETEQGTDTSPTMVQRPQKNLQNPL